MTTILLAILAIYVLLCLAVFFGQGKLVWFPGPAPTSTPGDHGLPFDDLSITTADGVALHAWRLRAENPRGAVVFCHGNAGNIEVRLERGRALLDMGFDVLLFDYRGYGGSAGQPSEEGTYLDAEAAWLALSGLGFTPDRIVVFGESLGGAVAIELARRRAVGVVVVEDTFSSLADMAATLYRWLPVRWILRIRYDSIAKVGALCVPLLVIHSREDELVPFVQGRRLFDAAVEPKRFLETVGPHNGGGFAVRADWRAAVEAFLREHVPPR